MDRQRLLQTVLVVVGIVLMTLCFAVDNASVFAPLQKLISPLYCGASAALGHLEKEGSLARGAPDFDQLATVAATGYPAASRRC